MPKSSRSPIVLPLWLCFCAFWNVAGWSLSAVHFLNWQGYALCSIIGLSGLIVALKRSGAMPFNGATFRKIPARFRRVFPLIFLVLAALAILGGMLYPPNNYDALTYRTPRVLHWLADGRWNWIHTPDARMNTRSTAFEWLTAPLFALTGTDRLIFLPNVVSFLLMPGLIFSVFTRLGISRRVAWPWMWLLPAGYNFVLQAASATNDLFGAVFALAALDFALRARESRKTSDVWLSILAASLLTGSKASNAPLLLPWIIALWFSLPLLRVRPVASAAVLVVALACSFLPNAALNIVYCHDWSGATLEPPHYRLHKPVIGIVGNALSLGLDCLTLPVMPLPRLTGQKLACSLMPTRFLESYEDAFKLPFGDHWGTGIQTEDGVGLGFGISAILVLSVAAAWALRRRWAVQVGSTSLSSTERWLLLLSPWVSLLVYFANAGMGQVGRLLTPYYALLVPLLLTAPAQRWVVRQSWWRWCGYIAFLLAATLLLLSPARPLLPVRNVLNRWKAKSDFLARADASYLGNLQRYDGLGPVRALLPTDADAVGFVSGGNDIEPSLWRPFWKTRVDYILPSDTGEDVRKLGIHYVVLGEETLHNRGQSLDAWLKAYDAEKVAQISLTRTFPPYIPAEWYIAKMRF